MSYQQFRPRSFQTLPPVIKNLLIINILMFAATWVLKARMDIDLTEIFGLHYITATNFKPFQFITYLFMHGNFAHLFFNMFAVWMFGSQLENIWGAKRFLFYYLVTGFGAGIIQYVVYYFEMQPVLAQINEVQSHLNPDTFKEFIDTNFGSLAEFSREFNSFAKEYNTLLSESQPKAVSLASQFLMDLKKDYINSHVVIGASGALFGILLAFGMLFPNTYIYVYFMIPVKAKWIVIAYGAMELFAGISNNPQDNVAHFAHLGGMLFGLIIILIWKKRRDHFY